MFDSAMSLDLESPQLLDDVGKMNPPPSPSLMSFVKQAMHDVPSERPSISALLQVRLSLSARDPDLTLF